MRLLSFPLLLLLLRQPGSVLVRASHDFENHDHYVVHLQPDVDPLIVSEYLCMHYDGPVGEIADHYVFRADGRHEFDHIEAKLLQSKETVVDQDSVAALVLDSLLWSQKQELHKRFPLVQRKPPSVVNDRRATRLSPRDSTAQATRDMAQSMDIEDPHFHHQWHLYNTAERGHDINVTGVWKQGITGKKSTVCVVDDGIDLYNPDLRANYFNDGSWDFNNPGPDPQPGVNETHGTRSAGEIGAAKNGFCGVGVAYDTKITATRILSGLLSSVDEAKALNFDFQRNMIYSCAWGPPDDGMSMEKPDILVRRALVNGVQKGRGGLGSIYVFPAGNGGPHDDCNFDGYANSIYSVTVGAIDRHDNLPSYSEKCSAQMVVTYSSNSEDDGIMTTDLGVDGCSASRSGTSAASPLLAGIYALMLDANPALTWRDIQWLTVIKAIEPDGPRPSDYQLNEAIGKGFSHHWGYGKADAYAMVEGAKTWQGVKPQAWFRSPFFKGPLEIPEGERGLLATFEVTEEALKGANLARLEHVTVTMTVKHARRGDIAIELRSPSGMVSQLATTRKNDDSGAGYVEWSFMSVAHWGEAGVGTWTLLLYDPHVNQLMGFVDSWYLTLWGESIDRRKQTLLPLPTDFEEDRHMELQPADSAEIDLPDLELYHPEEDTSDVPMRPLRPVLQSMPMGYSSAVPPSNSIQSIIYSMPMVGFSGRQQQVWIYVTIVVIFVVLSAVGVCSFCRVRRRRDRKDYQKVEHDEEGPEAEESPLTKKGGIVSRLLRGRMQRRSSKASFDTLDDISEEIEDEEDEEKKSLERDEYRV